VKKQNTNSKGKKAILAGIIGVVIMTLVMMVSPMMGMQKMLPPEMLAEMLGIPVLVAWVMHFLIGITFAFAYTYLCILKAKVSNIWLRGAVFGIIAFVFAQIMMGIMGAVLPMPKMEGSLALVAIGSLMGHIIFGMAVSKTVGNVYCIASPNKRKKGSKRRKESKRRAS